MEAEKNVLLLGMVFAHQATEPKRGQEFRDRVRCEALRNLGYNIYTLDDKHEDAVIEEHCRANFADTRRMMQSMKSKWSKVHFEHIVLDYFFSPVGWARQRWNAKFFSTTLPTLAKDQFLMPGGKIWLPNLDCIQEQLDDNKAILSKYFDIKLVQDCKMNPLYLATEDVEKELLTCPDILTNETQIRPLLEHSDRPFYVLEVKSEEDQAGPHIITPIPVRSRKTTTRVVRNNKRGYVSDTTDSEPSTPVMKRVAISRRK